MGNPFPIDLRVFGHSIGRLHDPNVVKADKKISCNSVEMLGKSMKFNEIQWNSMKINENHWKLTIFSEILHHVVGLWWLSSPSSRWIECPNTRKSIGNGFPLKKYVGAVVRKLSQLIKVVEMDAFENKMQYRNMYTKYNDRKKQDYIVSSKIYDTRTSPAEAGGAPRWVCNLR